MDFVLRHPFKRFASFDFGIFCVCQFHDVLRNNEIFRLIVICTWNKPVQQVYGYYKHL